MPDISMDNIWAIVGFIFLTGAFLQVYVSWNRKSSSPDPDLNIEVTRKSASDSSPRYPL